MKFIKLYKKNEKNNENIIAKFRNIKRKINNIL